MIDPHRLAALQAIGLTPALTEALISRVPEGTDPTPMRVTEVQREGLQLHDGQDEHAARAMPSLTQQLLADDDAIAVGDWVLAQCNVFGEWWVHQRVPPTTQIARRLHDGREKVTRVVIVSNVDTAFLVMGLDHDFSLRRLERFVALAQMARITPVVVLSKADLCADVPARVAEVQALLPAQAAVVAVNALSRDACTALAPWLQCGQTVVLLGSSGTGKSTLTNTLVGSDVAVTGANRSDDSRGRHTTTSCSLYRTAGGACIIDTPGLRTLRLDGDAAALGEAFADVAHLAGGCRFRDCRHFGEPGCAVRGTVSDERLNNYNKLLREARRDTLTALEHKVQVQQWKARGRQARIRAEMKRG
jgi:ribosome biogenesis GTPase